jgi:hypothetical protein
VDTATGAKAKKDIAGKYRYRWPKESIDFAQPLFRDAAKRNDVLRRNCSTASVGLENGENTEKDVKKKTWRIKT